MLFVAFEICLNRCDIINQHFIELMKQKCGVQRNEESSYVNKHTNIAKQLVMNSKYQQNGQISQNDL